LLARLNLMLLQLRFWTILPPPRPRHFLMSQKTASVSSLTNPNWPVQGTFWNQFFFLIVHVGGIQCSFSTHRCIDHIQLPFFYLQPPHLPSSLPVPSNHCSTTFYKTVCVLHKSTTQWILSQSNFRTLEELFLKTMFK
jgi:hypothetical protein